MKITKIVLTGGPCAGKSTAMTHVKQAFEQKGYSVLLVHETATEMITGGAAPWTLASRFDFQKYHALLQLYKEKIFDMAAAAMPTDKVLIVYDRGQMDCKSFLTAEEFDKLLDILQTNEVAFRDKYDAVFHLVTAAKGAESFYSLENNNARTETLEQARESDDRIIAAWTGHPHFRIIDNSTEFEAKIHRLIAEIAAFLGEPEPFEIERKFLIQYPDTSFLESLPNCQKVDILQTYLASDNEEEVRVRQRGDGKSFVYFETRKRIVDDIKRVENERQITQDEYVTKLMDADPNIPPIRKTRYCLTYNNQYFEVDIYPFWKDKAIIEIELNDANATIDFPPFITILEEVTGNEQYKNANLAVNKGKIT